MTYQTPGYETDSSCPQDFLRRIDAYLDGQMDERQMDAFEQVYFTNNACLEALRLRRRVRDLVSSEGAVLFAEMQPSAASLPTPAVPGVRPGTGGSAASRWLLAATVLLLAGLTGLWVLLAGSASPQRGNLAVLPAATANDPLFARFAPLEELHSRQQRSAAMAATVLPPDNAPYRRNLQFGGKEQALPAPMDLRILSNSGEILYHYRIVGEQFVFDEDLPAGMYYWLLENRRETLAVGRFVVLE